MVQTKHDISETVYFVDLTLPFGLRSSAKLFTDMAYALKLAMSYRGATEVEHYLDDYITMGPSNSPSCNRDLNIMLDTCAFIGFKVNPSKVTTPSSVIELLGLIIDSNKQEIRVSDHRVADIMEELYTFRHRRTCTKRKLLSLIGKLVFVSRAVRSGRSFVRRIINLSKRAKHLHYKLHLNKDVCHEQYI